MLMIEKYNFLTRSPEQYSERNIEEKVRDITEDDGGFAFLPICYSITKSN